MRILGISTFRSDSTAALVENGQVIAAAQEERFTRKKHDPGFPIKSIEYCLDFSKIQFNEIDAIAFCCNENPIEKRNILHELKYIQEGLSNTDKIHFIRQNISHSASAFFPSPFEEAAILTIDGTDQTASMSISIGRGNSLSLQREAEFPHSLGLLYSAITNYLGFKINSGEYKVMGLAPYGDPRYLSILFDNIVHINEDGSIRLDISYFDYMNNFSTVSDKFCKLFSRFARVADKEPLDQFHMDMAASIQSLAEYSLLKMARHVRKSTGMRNLCLAGSVALNCVANGKISRDGIFDGLWIQPASGEAGGALGAALACYHLHKKMPRRVPKQPDGMRGALLGPEWRQDEIEKRLIAIGAHFTVLSEDEILAVTAQALAEEKIVGWVQGRMEFGPRALGNRSILANPRSIKVRELLNLDIKYRENFRPFAPSVLREDVEQWFELKTDSPYMLLVAPVNLKQRLSTPEMERTPSGLEKLNTPRSTIPAVTHVDYSARIQTVSKYDNNLYHALITAFKKITNCGVLVNTSFNVRGEPIVCTPEDAFYCFMKGKIDLLVVGQCLLYRS